MMKTLLRVLLVGLGVGIVIGWKLAQEQQKQKEKTESEAYANDPELATIRKERALEHQLDQFFDGMEEDDA
jgi:predicted negative regulator of RcsB-dependent stress response